MKLKTLLFPSFSALLSIVLASCGMTVTDQTPIEQLAKNDVNTMVMAGAVVGGVTGAWWGDKKDKPFEGAAIGATLGAAIGKQVGQTAANRRKKYASEIAFLDAEISSTNKAIAARRSQVTETRSQSSRTRSAANRLRNQSNPDTSSVKNSLKEADTMIAENNSTINNYRVAIAYLDKVIASSSAQKDASGSSWRKRVSTLQQKRSALISQARELGGANETLARERSRISSVQSQRAGGSGLPSSMPSLPGLPFKIPTLPGSF